MLCQIFFLEKTLYLSHSNIDSDIIFHTIPAKYDIGVACFPPTSPLENFNLSFRLHFRLKMSIYHSAYISV